MQRKKKKMTSTQINEFFSISESFKLPERVMEILFSEDTAEIFERYATIQSDLSFDGFVDYFQEEHSSRKAMMQDFTPRELAELVGRLAGGNIENCLDVCAGTGGLSIALHNLSPNCILYCEELSERAIPLLLFNLAVRNIEAYVSNKNVLTGTTLHKYHIAKGEKFGRVEHCEDYPEPPVDVCITNPPYSLKWEYNEEETDKRFEKFGYPPKQYADLGFIIHGMSRLKEGGRAIAILPHGCLFRGGKEAEIRRKMVASGNIHSVIGLPDKLFLNTGIPVAVMIFGQDAQGGIFFVDASKEYEKNSKQSKLTVKNIKKILDAVKGRTSIDRYSHYADIREIKKNEYNLNISRYVDTYEPPPPIDIIAVTKELYEHNCEIKRLEKEIYTAVSQMSAADAVTAAELEAARRYLGKVAGIE